MGKLLGNLLKTATGKIVFTALGISLFFGYVSLKGGGNGNYQEVTSLPPVVFGGGGGVLEFNIDLNQAGEFHASFSQWNDETDEDEREFYVTQPLDAGSHQLRVDVAIDAYGYFQLKIDEPEVGAELAWTVKLDGRPVGSDEMKLDEPLDPRYAFFINMEFDDISELAGHFPAD